MRPRGPRASTCLVSRTSGLAHCGALGSSSARRRVPGSAEPSGLLPSGVATSTRAGLLAARGALPETPRPLQLLWNHRELDGDHAGPLRSAHPVAEVVGSPRRTVAH